MMDEVSRRADYGIVGRRGLAVMRWVALLITLARAQRIAHGHPPLHQAG